MKINQKLIKMFQEGGAVEAPVQEQPQEAPAQSEDQAVLQAAQAVVTQLMDAIGDPQAVAAILQAALEMVAGATQEAQPTFSRQGGKLSRVRK